MGKHHILTNEDVIEGLVAEYVKTQPWYKKNANTISASIGIAATIASSLTASGLELPAWAITLATGVVALASVFGVKKTKNGIQSDTGKKIATNGGV